MLSSSELAAIRADIANMLPDTCNILTAVETSDGQGGFTTTWGTAAGGTAVACRFDPARGGEQNSGAALQPYQGYIVTLPYTVTITTTQRIQHNGLTYAVISADKDKSWIASKRVYVEAV